MKRVVVGLVFAFGLWACDDDPAGGGGGVCGSFDECELSIDCPAGQVCGDDSCCEEFGCVSNADCDPGYVCEPGTGECLSLSAICVTEGCVCHILSAAGQLSADGSPSITLPAGAAADLQIVLATAKGLQLPAAGFTFTVADEALFAVDGSTVTAEAGAGGETTVTATLTDVTPCSATLVNLGNAPAGGNVRFYLFDDQTAQPVSGATVVVDTNSDGVDDGGASTTGADGVTVTTVAPTGPFTVTVFAAAYNYLSVVGLDAAVKDYALPLAARPIEPEVGGFTGKLDFASYEKQLAKKSIKVGIVSSSFPLQALMNFNLDLLIGPMTEADCESVDAQGNHPAGCYLVEIPSLVSPTWMALPGGAVFHLASNAIKGHFDVVGSPGRRYAWSLGAEADLTDLGSLLGMITELLTCSCNVTEQCDADCTCDRDCGLSLDFGAILQGVVPLLNFFASGVQGDLPLKGVGLDVWEQYISAPYGADRANNPDFPKLDDDGDYSKLSLNQLMKGFSDLSVPDLPQDPAVAGQAMEAMIMLTGANTQGFGFVPLGLAVGLDCTAEDGCLDRATHEELFDGEVNGIVLCPDPGDCPNGVPSVADGHVGLFYAPAHGGLEGQELLTLAIALPVNALLENSSDIRVSALIERVTPQDGVDAYPGTLVAGKSYPTFPARADELAPRQYSVTTWADADVHWVTVATEADANGSTTRWNIYFPKAGGAFRAPELPEGSSDPFDHDRGAINVTHIGFRAPSAALKDLAANNGTSLTDLLDEVDGFTVRSGDITVTP